VDCAAALQSSDGALPCGIYSSTFQPTLLDDHGNVKTDKDGHATMVVIDTAIGWKQPNGFYYPPAFAYRGSTFFKRLPSEPVPAQPLNQCFSFGADNGFLLPKERPGSCRHDVIDRTLRYVKGNMDNLIGGFGVFDVAPDNTLSVSPIDFSTILLDLDRTLTGATGT